MMPHLITDVVLFGGTITIRGILPTTTTITPIITRITIPIAIVGGITTGTIDRIMEGIITAVLVTTEALCVTAGLEVLGLLINNNYQGVGTCEEVTVLER